ncbi:TRAP transporter substrate-binding protein [Nocardiopsis salina]|uniref:TRAP transporter substrate-binding protein n=1 Tax=Nocardiopsis salina TaxID=245836 RepID=UPI0003497B52|nr:TRAP transporter substrate-binding protein [Nocardiopsis salina]
MKRPLALLSAAVLAAALTSCDDDVSDGPTTVLRVGGTWDEGHPMSVAVDEVFEPKVEELSGGSLSIETYHAGVLGNEDGLWDGVRNGSIDTVVIGSVMNQEYPTMLISDWPFLYRDLEHARDVWTGGIGDDLAAEFEEEFPSTYLLGWGPNGARTFSSSRPLEEVDDLEGQRFRVPANPIHIGMTEQLGASPQVIPLGELFTALETGVVDGQDNGMVTITSEAMHEVQDYVYETDHIIATLQLIISAPVMDGLTEQEQQIVREAASEATDAAWDRYLESVDDDRAFLGENGVTVTRLGDSDREEMIDRLAPLYERLYAENDWAEDLVAEIEAVE